MGQAPSTSLAGGALTPAVAGSAVSAASQNGASGDAITAFAVASAGTEMSDQPAALLQLLQKCALHQPIFDLPAVSEQNPAPPPPPLPGLTAPTTLPSPSNARAPPILNPDGTVTTGAQILYRLLHYNQIDLTAYDNYATQSYERIGWSFVCFWDRLPDRVFELGLMRGANPNALTRADGPAAPPPAASAASVAVVTAASTQPPVPVIYQLLAAHIDGSNKNAHNKLMLLLRVGPMIRLNVEDPPSAEADPHANNCLLRSCWAGWADVATALITVNHARVKGVRNRYGDDALMRLAKHGSRDRYSESDLKLADLLITSGADLHSENNDRMTVVSAAARSGKLKLVLLLMRRGGTLPVVSTAKGGKEAVPVSVTTPLPRHRAMLLGVPKSEAARQQLQQQPAVAPAPAIPNDMPTSGDEPRPPPPAVIDSKSSHPPGFAGYPTVLNIGDLRSPEPLSMPFETDHEITDGLAELFESHLVLSEYLNADLVVPVAAYLIGHVHAPF